LRHVVQTPFPAIPLGFFPPEKYGNEPVTIMVRGSNRIYREWKKIELEMKPKYVG
jgi:hypothetical protein